MLWTINDCDIQHYIMNAWHYEHSILWEVKPRADLCCGLAIVQEARAGLSCLIYEGETQKSFKYVEDACSG